MRAAALLGIEFDQQRRLDEARQALDVASGWALISIAESLANIATMIDGIVDDGLKTFTVDAHGLR